MADSVRPGISKLALIVFIFCNIINQSHQALDTSVCDPHSIQNSPTPKKPTLSENYKLTVECNIDNSNYTTDYTEIYNRQLNFGAAHQWFTDFHVDSIYDATNDQLFSIEVQTGLCVVSDLSKSPTNFLFGYQPSTSNPKIGRLFSAYGALRFGNSTNEHYMGRTTVRGISVNEWKSCQYWPSLDSTMEVHWYFSTPSWDAAVGRSQVPVRATVWGKSNKPTTHLFNHTYEFSTYETNLPISYFTQEFETPTGIICPGRKDTLPLPTPSNYFVFTSEVLTLDLKSIGFIKEWYDYKTGLVRYDYKPQPNAIQPYGNDFLSEVHDFSEGLAYIRDPMIGNCSITAINGHGIDAEVLDANHVRIRTSKEFFYFNKADYAYSGIKHVRGMDCDVWITNRKDWPPGSVGVKSTWEWYFARQKWRESTGHAYVFGMPLMLNVISDIGHYVYNIYNFDDEQPSVWEFDITKCYNYTDKKDFTFKVPGSYQNIAAKNIEIFKYFVMLAVHKVTGVSPLRITEITLDYDAKNILVSLTLLGPVPKTGDVSKPAQQVNLQTAETLLTNAINNNQLQIDMDTTTLVNSITLTAQPYSLTSSKHVVKEGYYKQPPSTGTRYSAGALAGLGVAMAIVFFALGFLGVYLFYRKNGGSFGSKNSAAGFEPKRFDEHNMEDAKQYENEK